MAQRPHTVADRPCRFRRRHNSGRPQIPAFWQDVHPAFKLPNDPTLSVRSMSQASCLDQSIGALFRLDPFPVRKFPMSARRAKVSTWNKQFGCGCRRCTPEIFHRPSCSQPSAKAGKQFTGAAVPADASPASSSLFARSSLYLARFSRVSILMCILRTARLNRVPEPGAS